MSAPASVAPSRSGPMVSVIMPVYNEQKWIARAVRGVLANDYPGDRLELLVVDGRSTDETREIVRSLQREDPRVRILDNPKRQKSAALNLGIAESRGDVLIRVDAHAEYPEDYVSRLVEGLHHFGADNIGSLRHTSVPHALVPAALALLVDSRFAAGNAYYRTGSRRVREVESVFGGCYRREVFDRIGTFDERLIRCQDRDLNDRLRAAGGKIVLDPGFHCLYHARSDLKGYLRWQAEGGEWVFRAGFITGRPMTRWRNYVPLAFLGYLGALGLGARLTSPGWFRWLLAAPGLAYAALDVAESIRLARSCRRPALAAILLPLFPANHLAYGIGSLRALILRVTRRV